MEELLDGTELASFAVTETAEGKSRAASDGGACSCGDEGCGPANASSEIEAGSGTDCKSAPVSSGGFRLDFTRKDRLDLIAADALTSIPRWKRDNLIAQIHAGRLEHLLPGRHPGLEALPAAANKRAGINIIDYAFEALVLPTMGQQQLDQYFTACAKTLRMPKMESVEEHGPLWFDTVHHVCSFSVIYTLAAHLRRRGYRKFIVLHQWEKTERRMELLTKGGGWWSFIRFAPGWSNTLVSQASPDAAIFYPVDFPLDVPGLLEPDERGLSLLRLGAKGVTVQTGTATGSAAIARKLGAVHLVLDYPSGDTVEVRRFDGVNPVAHCPLEDWLFWPALTPVAPR
jgi:hypothetical protein